VVEDEYIVIGGWPVQFLPPSGELEREAVAESVSTKSGRINTCGDDRRITDRHRAAKPAEGSQPHIAVIEQDAGIGVSCSIIERYG